MSLFPRFFTAAAVAATLAMGASAAMAGPYSVRWGGVNEREINPIVYDNGGGNYRTAAQYYSYSSPVGAAANTPDNLERSNTATMFLYNDPNNGLSLFHIYDDSFDADGSRVDVNITSAGLAGTGQSFLVRDDPGDTSFVWNDATGSANLSFFSSPCCTDGWALGMLPDASGDSWSVNADFTQLQGIDTFDIVTLRDPFTSQGARVIDRFSIAANQINTLEFVRTGETVTAVSESTMLIFPLAAIGLLALRRRRN
jgi:MYXO-CTERM domain-containing protein